MLMRVAISLRSQAERPIRCSAQGNSGTTGAIKTSARQTDCRWPLLMAMLSSCKHCKQTPSALRVLRTASSLPWQSPDSRPPPPMPARLMPSPRRPTTPAMPALPHANSLPPPTTPVPAPAHAKPVPPPSPLALASMSRGTTMKRWLSNLPFAAQWMVTSWPVSSITPNDGTARPDPQV